MATLKDKEKRDETNRRQKWDGVNAFVESTGRGLKNIIIGGGNKRDHIQRNIRPNGNKRNHIQRNSSPNDGATPDRRMLRRIPTAIIVRGDGF
jgi:hypothetical protein